MSIDLPIPPQTLDQIIAVLAKTRSGKSSVLRLLVEHLLDRDMPVCIVDPKGDWWGLKLSADGKGPGYPIVIFGGQHADVPLNEHAGAAVAELVATGNRPCLIDLKGWMPGARSRFWVDFASTLFRMNKGRRWLIADEFHNFAPKGRTLDPLDAKALHWSSRIASEGLGLGINLVFASQRPQKVHNDVLTSAETLIALRVLHPSDRDAIADWIKGCGDPRLGAEVLSSLADLARGEGWVWSPEIKFGPTRIQFPKYRTYDSFKPPEPGDDKKLTGWASVNLDEVRARLDAVIEEAKANDPKELKAKIAELERQIEVLQVEHETAGSAGDAGQTDQAALDTAHADGFEEGRQEGYRDGLRALEPIAPVVADLKDRLKEASDFAADIERLMLAPMALAAREPGAGLERPQRPVPAAPTRPQREVSAAPPRRQSEATGALPGPQQRILDAIRWWESVGINAPTRVQVAVVASYSPSGGAFQNPLGLARTAGFIEYPQPGTVAFTREGRVLANRPAGAATTPDLHAKIMAILDGPQQRILAPLLRAFPRDLSREDVAKASGYEANGGAFQNPLGALRSLGLIDYPQRGRVAALPILFIGGKR